MSSDHDHAGPRRPAWIAANATSGGRDPTQTTALRSRYSAEMYRRFTALSRSITIGVEERDAFGLTLDDAVERRPAPNRAVAANAHGQGPDINIRPPRAGEFAFPSDEDKVDSFLAWVDEQVDRGILETRSRGRGRAADARWQNTYIRSAYEKGVQHADAALVDMGVIPPDGMLDDVFRAPVHADAVGMLYTRSYRELRGVTEAMAQDMTRELTEGFTQGENPRKIGRRLRDRVDKVGIHRGRLIARTETIRAHNEGGLNRYEDMGSRLSGVEVVAEHLTAGDRRVCPVCRSLEGRLYTTREARGRIPVHPNCRCTWVPVQRPRGSGPSSPARSPEPSGPSSPAPTPSTTRGLVDEALDNDPTPESLGDVITEATEVEAQFGGMELDAARKAAEVLADLDDAGELRGFGASSQFDRLTVKGGTAPGDSGGVYAFRSSGGVASREIRLDDDVFGQNDPDWAAAMREGDAFLAGSENAVDEHILIHELGHARHHVAVATEQGDPLTAWKLLKEQDYTGAKKLEIANDVSVYATTNPLELVAETYAARVQGREYSESILAEYDRVFGPDVEAVDSLTLTGNVLRAMTANRDAFEDVSDIPEDLPPFLVDEGRAVYDAFEDAYGTDDDEDGDESDS